MPFSRTTSGCTSPEKVRTRRRDALLSATQDGTLSRRSSADYPAVVSVDSAQSAHLLKPSLDESERRVQGVLVQGLTDDDVAMLDQFEGNVSRQSLCRARARKMGLTRFGFPALTPL